MSFYDVVLTQIKTGTLKKLSPKHPQTASSSLTTGSSYKKLQGHKPGPKDSANHLRGLGIGTLRFIKSLQSSRFSKHSDLTHAFCSDYIVSFNLKSHPRRELKRCNYIIFNGCCHPHLQQRLRFPEIILD